MATAERYDDPFGSLLREMWLARRDEAGAWARQRPPAATDLTGAEGLFGPPVEASHFRRIALPAETVISVETTWATFLSWPEPGPAGLRKRPSPPPSGLRRCSPDPAGIADHGPGPAPQVMLAGGRFQRRPLVTCGRYPAVRVELLVHTDDALSGLGVAFAPPADLCRRVLAHQFPGAARPGNAWHGLLAASGRAIC